MPMEPIDPIDQANLQAINDLLERSRRLKEKAQTTNAKLDELKHQSSKLTHESQSDSEKSSVKK